jgi:hypothetical protein
VRGIAIALLALVVGCGAASSGAAHTQFITQDSADGALCENVGDQLRHGHELCVCEWASGGGMVRDADSPRRMRWWRCGPPECPVDLHAVEDSSCAVSGLTCPWSESCSDALVCMDGRWRRRASECQP